MSEIWNLNAICRCCHSDGQYKSLREHYFIDNVLEIYSVMIQDTFGIVMSPPQVSASYMICDKCIESVRDAYRFKQQVIACEEKFDKYCKNEVSNLFQVDIQYETDIADLKDEPSDSDDGDMRCDDGVSQIDELNTETKSVEDETSATDVSINDKSPAVLPDIKQDPKKKPPKYKKTSATDVSINDKSPAVLPEIKQDPKKKPPKYKKTSATDLSINVKSPAVLPEIKQDPKKKPPKYKKIKPNTQKSAQDINKKGYKCTECDKKFLNKVSFERHKRDIDHVKQTCAICTQVCTTITELNNHLKSHRGNYACRYCNRKLENAYSHILHEKFHTFRPFTCDICQKTFAYKSVLRKHILWHNGGGKKVMCEICGGCFNDAANLRAHVQAVHEKIKPFKCECCQRMFFRKRCLLRHQETHSGVPLTIASFHSCDKCEKTFKKRKNLEIHKLIHENKWRCRICNEVFDARNEYLLHLKDHKRPKKPQSEAVFRLSNKYPYIYTNQQCKICLKVLKNKYSLNRHMGIHSQEKSHKCNYCYMSFVQKTCMEKHVQRKHKEVIKETCPICNKMFKNVEEHMKCHQNKPFSCEICFRTYTANNTLNRHIQQVHIAPGSFKCNMCDKKYNTSRNLNLHKARKHASKTDKKIIKDKKRNITKTVMSNDSLIPMSEDGQK